MMGLVRTNSFNYKKFYSFLHEKIKAVESSGDWQYRVLDKLSFSKRNKSDVIFWIGFYI